LSQNVQLTTHELAVADAEFASAAAQGRIEADGIPCLYIFYARSYFGYNTRAVSPKDERKG
jgi:hypothetical protein